MGHDDSLDVIAFAKGVVSGGHGDAGHPGVIVLEHSVPQPHPLVGDHPAQLRGVAGGEEGVGQVDELSRLAAAQALLGPGEGAVHGMVPGHQNVARLNVIRSISYQGSMGAGGASC